MKNLCKIILIVLLITACHCSLVFAKRAALVVDNSGSMYGCTWCSERTKDVSQEMIHALTSMLEIMDMYNKGRSENDRLEMNLFLFGGERDGREEFEEIVLSDKLDENISKIKARLHGDQDNSYHNTDFRLAFRRSGEILQKLGGADNTIFLTDGKDGGAPGTEFSPKTFGKTLLYTLADESGDLVQWEKLFNEKKGSVKLVKIEKGWEILKEFSTVLMEMLVPKGQDKYLYIKEYDIGVDKSQLKFTKISTRPGSYFFIFKGENPPVIDKLEYNNKPLKDGNRNEIGKFWSYTGHNILRIEIPDKSPAGDYTLILNKVSTQATNALVVGLEDIKLQLLPSGHRIEDKKTYARNEEVVFSLGFASIEDPTNVLLHTPELENFLKLIEFDASVVEEGYDKVWSSGNGRELSCQYTPTPKNQEAALYTIYSSWHYKSSDSPGDTAVGTFRVMPYEAMALRITYTNDNGGQLSKEALFGETVNISASFDGSSSIPSAIQELMEIKIKDSMSGEVLSLQRLNSGEAFQGSAGHAMQVGSHAFSLVPLDPIVPRIMLQNSVLKVLPRALLLTVNGKRETGDGTHDEKPEEIGEFPHELPVLLPYQGRATEQLEIIPHLNAESTRPSDHFKVKVVFDGPASYNADQVDSPSYMAPFIKGKHAVDEALVLIPPPNETMAQMSPIQVVFTKKECDWQIDNSLTPVPSLSAQVLLVKKSGEDFPVAEGKVYFDIRTAPFAKEIEIARRSAVFLSALLAAAFLLFSLLVTLIAFRVLQLKRKRLAREIERLRPDDFCTAASARNGIYPEKGFDILQAFANKRNKGETPAELLRKKIRGREDSGAIATGSLLKKLKLWQGVKTDQMAQFLSEHLKQENVNSTWDFKMQPGAVYTIESGPTAGDDNSIRLRLHDFDQEFGRFFVKTKPDGVRELFFTSSHMTVLYKETFYIPPSVPELLIVSNDILLIGPHRDDLRLKVAVFMHEDSFSVKITQNEGGSTVFTPFL